MEVVNLTAENAATSLGSAVQSNIMESGRSNTAGGAQDWTLQMTPRERQIIKEYYHKAHQIGNLKRKLSQLRSHKDFLECKEVAFNLAKELDKKFVEEESLLAIINKAERRQRLHSLIIRVEDVADEDPTVLVSQHRDEFIQYLWKRKLEKRRHIRYLLSDGPRQVYRIGEMLSDSFIETIKSFEQHMQVIVCNDSISNGFAVIDDLPGYFLTRLYLLRPLKPIPFLSLDEKRLSYSYGPIQSKGASSADKEIINEWGCVVASDGLSYSKMLNKPAIKDLLLLIYRRIYFDVEAEALREMDPDATEKNGNPSNFKQILANVLDACFPSHSLSSLSLAFPLLATDFIRNRLIELGLKTESVSNTGSGAGFLSPSPDNGGDSDEISFTSRSVLDMIRSLLRRLDRELRFYFEFTVTETTNWRVGYASEDKITQNNESSLKEFPGQNAYSFGFGNNGKIYFDGMEVDYLTDRIHVTSGRWKNPAYCIWLWVKVFHGGCFSQAKIIPMFAIQGSGENQGNAHEILKASLQVNFGSGILNYRPNCMTCDSAIIPSILKNHSENSNNSSVDSIYPSHDVILEIEEDRMALEKNAFRSAFIPEVSKSFSQFPPSVYRRSLAASRIQRAWRRYKGRKWRKEKKREMVEAAKVIQRFARMLLSKIKERKNAAALKIQKLWRKTLYIKVRLLSVIYRTPISELHRDATLIQRKYREWSLYRNSPIAAKYAIKLDLLTEAITKIQNWWRPLIIKKREQRKLKSLNEAATKIQRLWRGYRLRNMLRPDLREKMGALGRKVIQHRRDLMVVRAAYIIQKMYRSFMRRQIRRKKIETRNKAAAKIQAIWAGYWTRTRKFKKMKNIIGDVKKNLLTSFQR